jgi:L,D-transpeptidase YbiS
MRADGMMVEVDLSRQVLWVHDGQRMLAEYPVSTARNGPGERVGSECTPRGWHQVRAKIGEATPVKTVFVGRRPTGERYTPELGRRHPDRDWILTRILWLSGLERGKNRLGDVDSFRRFIYIHGCPEDSPMGQPASHGCIRMRNRDVMELFDTVPAGTRVFIHE